MPSWKAGIKTILQTASARLEAFWQCDETRFAIGRAKSWLRRRRLWLIAGLLGLWYAFSLPDPLFDKTYSTVLEDRNGQLLGARIAADGQWRFPLSDTVPEKFAAALTSFEDKRFYYHPGVDPLAMVRALRLNLQRGRIVSGGSTLSMQVIRLSRDGQARSLTEKLKEMMLATRLELSYSKAEILALYAAHAPFGGNVVGLEAAAWKYYGREAGRLSWAESATLAVLPNAPALIHPGRNREALRQKRDRLLIRLAERGFLDEESAQLAMLEPLPEPPRPLPDLAPHLLTRSAREFGPVRLRSTLVQRTQQLCQDIVTRHHAVLSQNGIHNAAMLILDVATGEVLAYAGNVPCGESGSQHGCDVDIITSRRSSGSILKPFLYAAMLQDGELMPEQLVPDLPASYRGYIPKNYERRYEGAVPASRALARSLNAPAVHLLSQYGVARFYHALQRLGIRTLDFPPEHYGLTLVLGGAETTLWDLAGVYAGMARTLRYHLYYYGKYDPRAFRSANYALARQEGPLKPGDRRLNSSGPLSAASIYSTFEALTAVNRPEMDREWQYFSSSGRIAWKTGTSFGFRDAWAVGCTPYHVVAVWAGNADGEGRPGLTGLSAAAPLLFDAFDALGRQGGWFEKPYGEMAQALLCPQSGLLAGPDCPEADSVWIPESCRNGSVCSFHRRIHLDPTGQWRVNSDCCSPQDMRSEAYFVLPPAQEAYYRMHNPGYRPLPPWRQDCQPMTAQRVMDLIYPRDGSRILAPVGLDGAPGEMVFEAVHRNPSAVLYWHLDETYIGETRHIHKMSLQPAPGQHTLSIVDDQGETLKRRFSVYDRNENR